MVRRAKMENHGKIKQMRLDHLIKAAWLSKTERCHLINGVFMSRYFYRQVQSELLSSVNAVFE
jgi:hypothetical protein